ncbi:MAG: aminotransferase class I/II-fold pyridoxal phosphate-dependent enzyme [Granulosicoccus sp.]|nr:aminotransferase class I/II-fold pyridoxal phosphate-dependent enzyme [Granulosicoccus sp.]
MTIPFTSIVQSLPQTVPFTGPETLERHAGKPFLARIGANESAFGISQLAQQAIQELATAQACSWYGDPENHELRQLLAEKHNVKVENICVDAGIDSLLGLTIRLFIEPGDTVVTSDGAYPTVNYHVGGFNGRLIKVPYRDHHEDPITLAKAANENQARLLYLANPDNPMGTSLDHTAIQTLIEQLPPKCLLMLDEAYVEFMTKSPVLTLDVHDSRVIRFRTFSKAYGMAGMRIGYVIAHHEIISGYNRIRNHFGVNRMAQVAAKASIEDSEFLNDVVFKVEHGRQRIYRLAESLGLDYLKSATNFVAVDVCDAKRADNLIQSLAQAGVFLRKPMVAPQNRYIRIGVGTDHEHTILEQAIRKLIV